MILESTSLSSRKFKLKPQWDGTIHLLEWNIFLVKKKIGQYKDAGVSWGLGKNHALNGHVLILIKKTSVRHLKEFWTSNKDAVN